ncbi:hypothetical protein PICST_28618 [Scheffersomyces stipitis CBS 6054]|uniref:Uncharacterized protein n=1 Tax=Scheffersomyces stipitis (strain ATCC 58785 / CBS 6054 / NBRC 10063 / NRRL Y-11545) TaxID=322104 RepID=A3GGI5_PICST|nr:predicted protein [Scheffersomyces stipitis CBS 6054]EAZ63939.2 hypothetical protein PICST_28618 [Scheffersomyces stipitis CBS 6054]
MPPARIELATFALQVQRSTTKLRRLNILCKFAKSGTGANPEGPLGVFSGESSSNQALNEPKPPDIDRNPHDHVAPPDSMDLDGESTDADENGNLEPSFVTAVSSTSEEPAQLRDNPMDESVIQNQTPLSPTMESFETSVSEIFDGK